MIFTKKISVIKKIYILLELQKSYLQSNIFFDFLQKIKNVEKINFKKFQKIESVCLIIEQRFSKISKILLSWILNFWDQIPLSGNS